MKAELQELRRKGALRPSEDGSGLLDGGRSCSRCRAELGWIVNRGAVCQACRLRVCRACREYTVRTIDWVCTVCYKRTEIQTATGEWMNEFVKKPGQNRFYMSAADIIKSTIRRSWTISDPTPRWPSSRDSPEFRPYNSLPRGQDVSEYPSLARASPPKKTPSPTPKTEQSVNKSSALTQQGTNETTEIDSKQEGQEEVTGQRQRRISLFERTLSELYDTGGKRSKRGSVDKSLDLKRDEKNETTEIKKIDVKPSKIPSPRRKVHTARSDSAAIVTKKEPVKKFSSLQNNKKSISSEKSQDKHVSFEHVEAEVIVKPQFKSGIPVRESKLSLTDSPKHDEILANEISKNEEGLSVEEPDTAPPTPELNFAQVETIAEETENVEIDKLSETLFRKVTVKRRRQEMKKSQAFDEGCREEVRAAGSLADRREEPVELDTGRILLPEGDDYKLVFISSDSSSKEEDADDNDSVSSSSATTAQSFSIDDCDWDYFEPSASIRPVLRDWSWSNRNSPFGSPRVYRRGVLDSPLGSPLVYRRARESDTGTDEDVTRLDSGSPASSDSVGFLSRVRSSSENEDHLPLDVAFSRRFKKQPAKRMEETKGGTCKENKQLQCKHQNEEPASVTEKCGGGRQVGNASPSLWSPPCRSCGAAAPIQSTQFVPIPVLVPIPVPVPASIWNPLDSVILYNTDALDNNLRMRLRTLQQRAGTMLWSGVNPASFISPLISTGDAATLLSVQHSLLSAVAEADMSAVETGVVTASERNPDQQHVTDVQAAETATSGSNTDNVPKEEAAADKYSAPERPQSAASSTGEDVAIKESTASEVASFNTGGYLQCERTYVSSSESSDSNVEQGARKPRVRRVYNVSGPTMRESDDALPDSDVSSDEEKVGRTSQSSVSREDDMSSSGSEETDSDDTGTVADQKPKRFSRIFIVNTNDSSSDVEDNTDSSSDTETSDNDTDTEKDCVILNYIRPLSEASTSDENVNEPVVLIKHVKSRERTPPVSENVNGEEADGSVVLLKHITCSENDNGASEMLVCAETNTIPESACVGSDIRSYTPGADSATESNESADGVVEYSEHCERIESECDQRTIISVSKEQASNVDVIKQADYTPATRNEKNVEFIGDCLQVVTEESKQTAIDLETRAETDMKVNNGTADVDGDRVSLLLGEELTPVELDAVSENSADSASLDSADSDDRECMVLSEDGSSESDVSEGDISRVTHEGNLPGLSEIFTATTFGSEWNDSTVIRSSDPVTRGEGARARRSAARGDTSAEARGARTGAPRTSVDSETRQCHVPARYTSLVMITQEPPLPQVSVVPSDTTTIIPSDADVIVRHTNWQSITAERDENANARDAGGLAGYFTVALESPSGTPERTTPRKPVLVTKTPVKAPEPEITLVTGSDVRLLADSDPNSSADGVTVVTGGDTLSAVVCLEDGLADDDSWVEEVSYDEDEFATTTATDSSSGEEVMLSASAVVDHEEELRGYHRSAIDFTLHTIVEESCEESEVEQSQPNNKPRPTSATDLEKYFFFRLGDGTVPNATNNREDAFSETSSIYSEGMDSLGTPDDVTNDTVDPAELASSRLEKYFLSGFMGFTAERRDSDGSVGSDSEGRPSPEQRRKRLVRARGTGRSHSSSLDNLLASAELSGTEQQLPDAQHVSENSSSSETDTLDELSNNFEKSDGQFDTVKRKKCKKQRVISGGSNSPQEEKKVLEITMEESNENKNSDDDEDGHKTPQPEFLTPMNADLANNRKQQSRDSGFIGSCDDLLKEQKTSAETTSESSPTKTTEKKKDLEKISEEKNKMEEKLDKTQQYTAPPATSLTRKDSFNNWSSDEETNLMMSKMRQFFKTMIANNSNAHLNTNSKPTTPVLTHSDSARPIPSPRTKNRSKPPQLVYFENELTRLMKTVPGIRDDQVREIVEYLSSEDTWSDSYDSSDYTSSDLEGATVAKSALQQQISASCQQIIDKFEHNVEDEEGDEGDGGIVDESQGLNRETAFVYQKLVASFNKIATGDAVNSENHAPHNSPPLIAKVMHHIGSRLVALMHEVSSGESHCSTSPKVRYHHRRLQQKLSSASTTTTEDDDSTSDSNLPDQVTAMEDGIAPYNLLPRSRSHDLLLGEARAHHQSSSGVSDIAEEREASDYERFSWRGSFESALMATDSRQKLSLLGAEGSASVSALAMAAKRRSAGDLLFSPKSLSREQLDRVRSCGSIGGGNSEDKHWVVTPVVRPSRRRSSVPDATCGSGGSADGEDDDEDEIEGKSTTLPRSLQTGTATTNSLPRLPTTANAANMHKAHSMHHFLQHNVKSARYRPPGFNRGPAPTAPKRAVSAPGLQPSHPRREVRRRSQQPALSSDDVSIADSNSSPIVGVRSGSKSASPSPVHNSSTLTRGTGSISSADWHSNEDDIDRLVAMHQNRSSLSSLGLRSDSMASVYSGAGEGRYGNVTIRGQVEFGLQYNYKAGALEIHVKQCRDLAPVDVKRNRSDPYVKVYLLPDKSKSGKRKTKVKKHTLNPVFDEILKFHLTLSGLETRTLWLTVWHSDMFGRNDFLGEVMMALENKVFDDPTPKWYNLQERTEPFEELPSYKGDIVVGLKFVPPDMTVQKKGKRSRGALHVLVKEAKNLTAVKANGTSDPFCKSYLLPDKGRSNKQKTPVLKRTTCPVWNHSFVYDDVTLQELAERSLELTVWDHDRLASNEFLGGVRFSLATGKHYGKSVDWMDASGKELLLWQSMLERPNFWVEGCVSLRSSLDHRSF